MALTNAYLITTKNLDAFFNAIVTAQAPERFTHKFLKDLDFTSTNDRFYVGVLKSLGFIDDSGVPIQRYYDFLDQTQSKRILAIAIREAYEDIFRLNKDAQKFTEDEVKNKLKTLTRGEKSDNVVRLMAHTFKALCEYADWSQSTAEKLQPVVENPSDKQEGQSIPEHPQTEPLAHTARAKVAGLHYNIQIHLPSTRDSSVYDAIFKSLKDHLLP
jgi:hypothetical protein